MLAIMGPHSLFNHIYRILSHTSDKIYLILCPKGKLMVVVIGFIKDNHTMCNQVQAL